MSVPNIPGPFDDAIVDGIAAFLEVYFKVQGWNLKKKYKASQLEKQKQEYYLENE